MLKRIQGWKSAHYNGQSAGNRRPNPLSEANGTQHPQVVNLSLEFAISNKKLYV